ncbi:hypothetical protein Taro_052229 [Colocasia esculenta]|uniref:RING-type domain-containing protein n=1 Tax=Colocasia esculenta TaxID=4460 RepID=A0A843XI20_COLES|nr:hypothetical protein [Colocasia esculenta]
MGLFGHLHDVSDGSILILLLAAAARWVSSLLSLLHSCGFHQTPHPREDADAGVLVSGLAGVIVLSEQLSSTHLFFTYSSEQDAEEEPECVVCLMELREGERARLMACCHRVFHSECLDRWFDELRLSCPLCRSPLAPDDRRAEVDRRIGAELVAWLSPY